MASETKALRASTERLYQERMTLEAETFALEELFRKQAHLNRRLKRVLAIAERQHQGLDRERKRILSVVGEMS